LKLTLRGYRSRHILYWHTYSKVPLRYSVSIPARPWPLNSSQPAQAIPISSPVVPTTERGRAQGPGSQQMDSGPGMKARFLGSVPPSSTSSGQQPPAVTSRRSTKYYIPPGLIASGYVLSLGAGRNPGFLASETIPFKPLPR
jgi:hypothetical protein